MTKTEQALHLLNTGCTKEALRIFSTFKLGLTVGQRKTLKTGYECLVHPAFYAQLKINVDKAVAEAVSLCNQFHKESAK